MSSSIPEPAASDPAAVFSKSSEPIDPPAHGVPAAGGGWLSGPMQDPLPPVEATNRADESPIVAEAVAAVEDWAGDDLDRKTVRRVLPGWKHFQDLSPQDMVAVLKRFPGKGDL